MTLRRSIAPFVLAGLCLAASAQEKKSLTHESCNAWNRISSESISDDGAWVQYTLEPQEGDPMLILLRLADMKADTIRRGAGGRFSPDSRFAAFTIKAPYADVKKAKIAKKKADETPKDSVGIVRLGSPGVTVVPRVKNFALPDRGPGWIAIHLEAEPTRKDSTTKKAGKDDADAEDESAAKKEEKGTTLIAHHLESGEEIRFPFATQYRFSKSGRVVIVASSGNDSTVTAGVFVLTALDSLTGRTPHGKGIPGRARIDTLARGRGKYTQVTLDEGGNRAAFLADRDTSKAKQRYYRLWLWKAGADSALSVADTATAGLPRRWLISENERPWFSKDGGKLYFGTAPVPMPDDTTFNDEETARLDVWNWMDGDIQSYQTKNLDTEKKRSYSAVLHSAEGRLVQLGDTTLPTLITANEGNASTALGLSSLPYRRLASWESTEFNDVFLVDLASGERTRVLEKLKGRASLSPMGRYVVWFDQKESHWYTMDPRTRRAVNVTRHIPVPLADELNDIPDDPNPYGIMGWMENDSLVYIYDRYDIWEVDPAGQAPPRSLTHGNGRAQRVTYRDMRLDPDERFYRRDSVRYLRAFDNNEKGSGYYRLTLDGRSAPEKLRMDQANLSVPLKARNAPVAILTRSTFQSFPDLHVSHLHFRSLRRISEANPQQAAYRWGTVELFRWTAADGAPIEGLLYKPEDYTAAKRYPMIVYYYERNSDLLHSYLPPAPSRSTINRAYCVSNEYVVFVPDIRYRTGYPGQGAYDCVIPGVRKLIRLGIADSTRMALQGQSWGGYQTAFLVTRTSMFRCAFAGAAVANMTSAYGGIRWESGLVRQFQYEKAQSRIGQNLWERPDLYIENSPLFHTHKVTTPLLLMHNDSDGAVPWQQGIELYTALRRLNKPVWMLVYNNEQHNLVNRRNMKDLSIRMMQFFDHYLKDAPMPVWMKTGIPATKKWKTMGYEFAN